MRAKSKATGKRIGRPSDYSPELAAEICARIAEGKSLRTICKADDMPDKSTVLRWLADDARREFRDHYARAREAQADTLAEEILEIADDASQDFKTVIRDGVELQVFDHEHVQRARLRVDARKWCASKLAPKKYGDKLELAGDPDNPPHRYVVHVPASMSQDEWAASVAHHKDEPGQVH